MVNYTGGVRATDECGREGGGGVINEAGWSIEIREGGGITNWGCGVNRRNCRVGRGGREVREISEGEITYWWESVFCWD